MEGILEVRELLYQEQQRLLGSGQTVIQLSLNMPGGMALYPWQELFRLARDIVWRNLRTRLIEVVDSAEHVTAAGPYYLWATSAHAHAVKNMLISLEESHPCGRLWDLDVLSREGPVDRGHLGLPGRKCLLCENEAHCCRKSSRHYADEVIKAAQLLAVRCIND